MIKHEIPRDLKLVILDCDGVLFDSFRSNVAFYNGVLERMGEEEMGSEAARLCHVYSTPQLFEHFFGDNSEKYRLAMHIAGEIDYLPFLEYMDPEPGLYEVLDALKARYRIAMATNRGKSAAPLLERFGLARTFETVSTIQKVANPKPAPDMLLLCLEETGLSPAEAVYVGDMENDLIAAEAAGIAFILKGNAAPHPLRIERLEELPGILTVS
jgi:phosphoglycolate phosphatase